MANFELFHNWKWKRLDPSARGTTLRANVLKLFVCPEKNIYGYNLDKTFEWFTAEHEENEEDSVKSVTLRAGVHVSDAHLKAATSAPCESPPCPSAAASQSPRWSSGSLSPPLKHSIQPSLKVTRLLSNDHSAVKMSQALIKEKEKKKKETQTG